nr:hypothetical protein [Tolivirales sp.]
MSKLSNEGAPAVEFGAMRRDKNHGKGETKNSVASSLNSSKSSLPLLVVSPSTSRGARDPTFSVGSTKTAPKQSKSGADFSSSESHTRKGKNNYKSQKDKKNAQKTRGKQIVAAQVGFDEYVRSEWYVKAVRGGFKNQAALDRFNQSVRDLSTTIDPRMAPVCQECGNSDLELCEHFISQRPDQPAVHVDDEALIIPDIPDSNISWRFMWVDRVRRMFTWPKFDNSVLINHSNRGFDPSLIPDDQVWDDMFMYIRLHLNTHYKIDGVFDRQAKLAHCNKLALRFLTDMKINIMDVLKPQQINSIKLTVARACDQRDDQTLFKEVDPRQNFWAAPVLPKFMTFRNLVIAGCIISPAIVSKLVTASMKTQLFVWYRLASVNAEVLAYGSVQALKYSTKLFADVVRAFLQNIWSGLVMPSVNATQPLLCQTVNTMSTSPYINVILRKLPHLNPRPLIWFLSSGLSGICRIELPRISSSSIRLTSC